MTFSKQQTFAQQTSAKQSGMPPLRDVTERERALGAFLGSLVDEARSRPDGRLDFQDESGATVATLQAYDLPVRPRDMPRALRPKQKLSKRQRDAAKRASRARA